VLFAASFVVFSVEAGAIQYREIIIATVIGRIGLGMILPALSLATLRHLEAHQLGQASVVFSYARQLGGVMGVAIVAVFIEWREAVYGRTPPGVHSAYAQGFMLLSIVLSVAIVATLLMKTERAFRAHEHR
jgi:hypothetical protein